MVESAKPVTETPAAASNATEEEKTTDKVGEEQSADVTETFDEPVLPDLKFRCSWTLWEHYEG